MSFSEFYRVAMKTTTDDESIGSSVAYCDREICDNEYDGVLRDAKIGPTWKSILFINRRFVSENYQLKRPDAIFVFGPKERFVGDKNFEEIVVPMLTKDTKVIYLD